MGPAPVKGAARLILIYMASSSRTGEYVHSSMTTAEMAKATGYSLRKVNAKLDEMIAAGVIAGVSGGWELNLTAGTAL
jgi:DNA-binding IscR family transcriptional regulator